MKRRMPRVIAVLALLAGGGFLVAASGLVPVGASSDHWPLTRWLLQFGMRRSVATHSLLIDVPPLDDPALVLKGATHYHTGCRSCHGSPEHPHPVIAQAMRPAALYLPERVAHWEDAELFYLVKHGVKFTGMPAWPAQQRDDEVWALVAFLRRFPELDVAEYRRLALGAGPSPTEAAPIILSDGLDASRAALLEDCTRCHGADGLGRGSAFPWLAGQPSDHLCNALVAYARGERYSGIMQPIAAGLEVEAIRELAEHFAGLPPAQLPPGDAAAIARGESIALHGIPSQRVPSCVDCHGPSSTRPNPAYPLHAGQPADYLVLQLELFKGGRRGGSAYAALMRPIASRLTAEQMRDVAAYYASLPADAR